MAVTRSALLRAPAAPAAPPVPASPAWSSRLGALRQDLLVRNSFFITLSNASMGALGFLFWILAAHLFPPAEVGLATTLVSAAIVVGYTSLLGFNTTFVRYLPTSDNRDEEINTGLILVFLGALVVGGLYFWIAPLLVPQLGFLRRSPAEAVAIVVFIAFGSVNLVTDSVFIAYRAAHYNVLVDGVIQGVIRLGLPALLVGLGAFGLFSAFGLAAVAAVVASLVLMRLRFSYRPRLRVSVAVIRKVLRFGAANYLANLLTMVPVIVLPLLIVRARGASAAGYFYLAMAVANLLFTASLAVGQSLLAEGSQRGAALRDLALRSGRLQACTVIPAGFLLLLGSRWILNVFGPGYASHATATLAVLALSTPAVTLNYWTSALLRIRHQLGALIWSNVVLAVVVCGLAAAWAHAGTGPVAAAWLIGNLASGLYGGAALLLRRGGGADRPGQDPGWVPAMAD